MWYVFLMLGLGSMIMNLNFVWVSYYIVSKLVSKYISIW